MSENTPSAADHLAEESAEELPFFVLIGEEAAGPWTLDQLQSRLAAGEVTANSYAWNQGMESWLPLHEIFTFADAPEPAEEARAQPADLQPADMLTVPAVDEPEPTAETIPEAAVQVTEEPPGRPQEWPVETLAGFGRRFAAGAIDTAIIVAALVVAMILLPSFRSWVELSAADRNQWLRVNLFLSLPVYAYYMLGFAWPGRGATPGYRALGLRLLSEDTRGPPGPGRCMLWCAASIAMVAGWPLYWFDRRRRMLQNIASRTIVVSRTQPQ